MWCRAGSRSCWALFGIEAADQFHRVFEVGEQHRDLLALAFEGALGGEDFLGQVGGYRVWSLGVVPVSDGERAAGVGSARSAPHFPQNTKPGGFSKSQCGQRGLSLVPQRPQKFMPAGFSKPQLGQCMGAPSGTAVRVAGGIAGRSPAPAPDRHGLDGVSVLQEPARCQAKSTR